MSNNIYDEPKVWYFTRPRQNQDREEQEVDIYESADRKTDSKVPRGPWVSSSPDPSEQSRFQLISAALSLLCVILLLVIGILLYYCLQRAKPQSPGPSPERQFYAGNSSFFVSLCPKSWKQSQNECEKIGANLTVINNQEKSLYLGKLVEEDLWIGLHRHQGDWKWVNGVDFSFNVWKKGVRPGEVKHGSAAFITKGGSWNYTDEADNVLKRGLCEKHIQ